MTYFDALNQGTWFCQSALLLHFKNSFPSEDFWSGNFSIYKHHSPRRCFTSQIAEIIGKEVADVNQSISNLTENGLLQYRTIELNGEIELIF